MSRYQPIAGYSLYELIMTLAVAAVVLGLGVPPLGHLVADQRLGVESNALFHAIHRARQESIVRRRVVSICASNDAEYCDPDGDWSRGWIVFANKGRTGLALRDEGERLISQHKVGATARIRSNRRVFSFRSTHLRATNGTLIVCDRSERAVSRAVIVSYTGRPRVARKNTRGVPYRCAG
jgi:type IV fimbrial biogenesis protein FimT